MKNCWKSSVLVAVAIVVTTLGTASLAAQQENDRELLQVREAVWRAWFAGDIKSLREFVPAETIVMSGGEKEWKNQTDVLRTAAAFHAQGGNLVRLEFPRTEVQHFGDVAIVWSDFLVETETNGQRSVSTGRASEIFVRRSGHWLNPGWHTDSTK
jgi:ketosteroid isomerase-like protein